MFYVPGSRRASSMRTVPIRPCLYADGHTIVVSWGEGGGRRGGIDDGLASDVARVEQFFRPHFLVVYVHIIRASLLTCGPQHQIHIQQVSRCAAVDFLCTLHIVRTEVTIPTEVRWPETRACSS